MAENHEARCFTWGHLLQAYIKAEDVTKPFPGTEQLRFFLYLWYARRYFPLSGHVYRKIKHTWPVECLYPGQLSSRKWETSNFQRKQTEQGQKIGRNKEKKLKEILNGAVLTEIKHWISENLKETHTNKLNKMGFSWSLQHYSIKTTASLCSPWRYSTFETQG